MDTVVPGQVMSASAPALQFISQVVGQALPAAALSFRILDMTTADNEMNPVQIFPNTGWHAVDLVNDLIPYDQLNTTAGYYAANWTVPSDAKIGKYAIEWQYELTNPSSDTYTVSNSEAPPSGIARKYFEVVRMTQPPAGSPPNYTFICDLRAALGCGVDVTDVNLYRLAARASRMIERVTKRYFTPRYQVVRVGGNSARKLLLGPAIVSLSSVGIDTEPTQRGDLVVDLNLLRIYNRHLAQNLIDPDDRNDPMIEFVHSDDLYGIRFIPFRGISLRSLAHPIGVQNIHVRGVFGYTDPDGSPWGDTPDLIQHACRLICAREAPKLGTDAREDAMNRWRVTQEKTRDNTIQLADPRKWGEFFGDPEIDSILVSFVRPPSMGST